MLKSGMVHPFFLLDDQYHYDNHNKNGEGISRIDYVFHTSETCTFGLKRWRMKREMGW